MLPPRLGAPSARPGPAAAAGGGGGGGRGGRPSHERRGSGLLGLAPKVPTGEEVEALRECPLPLAALPLPPPGPASAARCLPPGPDGAPSARQRPAAFPAPLSFFSCFFLYFFFSRIFLPRFDRLSERVGSGRGAEFFPSSLWIRAPCRCILNVNTRRPPPVLLGGRGGAGGGGRSPSAEGCRRRDALRGALPAAGSLCPWDRSSIDREGGSGGGVGGERLHEVCLFLFLSARCCSEVRVFSGGFSGADV